MEDGQMEQGILVIGLDVVRSLTLHGVVEISVEELNSLVVGTTSPSIEETVQVSDVICT
jgi:hypothetical protein